MQLFFSRCVYVEKSPSFYYVAMELAECNLQDFVEGKDISGITFSQMNGIAVLRDMSTALQWLHSRNISK